MCNYYVNENCDSVNCTLNSKNNYEYQVNDDNNYLDTINGNTIDSNFIFNIPAMKIDSSDYLKWDITNDFDNISNFIESDVSISF